MSKTLMTAYRAYATIEVAADECRQIGDLAATMSFNICEFIEGPLKRHFRGRLCIEILDDDRLDGPAKVVISLDRTHIALRAKRSVWFAASDGDGESRRILAHEIGHIWLHHDATFEFSDSAQDGHKFIPDEQLVEWQANVLADHFLMPLRFARGFSKLNELIEYCDYYHPLSNDLIDRQFLAAQHGVRSQFKPIYGECICPRCGSERVRSLFTYRKCDACNCTSY